MKSISAFRLSLVLVTVALVASVFAVQGCSKPAPADSSSESGSKGAATGSTEDTADATSQTGQEDPVFTPTYKPTGKEIAAIKVERKQADGAMKDLGVIKFEFYAADAPNHVAAFIELAQKGFYSGTKFHRVEPNFVIQGGDPLSKTDDPMVGTGGPGYHINAEFNGQKHLDGTVAMARAQDPDSAGSQFYICVGPQSFLDGQYTVFGQVTEGMDIVRQVQVGDVMQSVTIENAE